MKYEELQSLKTLAQTAKNDVIRSDGWAGSVEMAEHLRIDEQFVKAASPDAILALIDIALAASGGNAAPDGAVTDYGTMPELPEPVYVPVDVPYDDEVKAYTAEMMTAYGKACAAASAPNAALVAALQNLMHLADEFGIQSGVCCCGDDMKRHGNPMDCGHSPVDSGEYYTASAIEEARKALSAAGQEVKS